MTYSISQLSQEFGITTRSIRFYEEKGLLSPARSGQQRIFDSRDRVRLELILRGKRAGLSLQESSEILDMYEPGSNNSKQAQYLLNKVTAKREALLQQMENIQALVSGLDDVSDKCKTLLEEQA